ncbi:retinaldehyde-binding protein 1-like [Sitophilus oryzae]|uniref:Retinaldehyde-binding protein 1-like n=1 Tax=Sitophilus oryzae TaxID=7048 RepID=A0A6J2Y1B8_SITOR|nr:retinaldehyde-binding protein 1-like [Sitophilus oryzae]
MCALNLKHSHPFIDGLRNPPEGKKKDVQKIKSWMMTQPHLPEVHEEFIYLFLHACHYVHERTKSAIETWFTIRAIHPNIFSNRDPMEPKMKNLIDMGYLLRLPKTTPEGYRVLMYAVRDPDPTKMNFNDVVKGFCMYNDCVLSEDGLQEGYVIIFDMKDVSIGHLARVSLPALKCFLWYIQDAHPARIKSIHVLNTATWIHHVMRLVVPLVRSELLNLVKFHKGGLPEKFPTELLPMDYGGEAPTVEELDRTTKALLDKYSSWLIESSLLVADESKRPKKGSWWGLFSSKSNQQVEIDEKNILKNLQID